MTDISEGKECRYCTYPVKAGFVDPLYGEVHKEYEVFSGNQITINVGDLGSFVVSNYILEAVNNRYRTKKHYLVTHIDLGTDRIGPFHTGGNDYRRIEITHCPFCGREL